MAKLNFLLPLVFSCSAFGNVTNIITNLVDNDATFYRYIAEIARINYNNRNGYNVILCAGNFPDVVYEELRTIRQATIVNVDTQDVYHGVEDVAPYRPNIVIVKAIDFDEFEDVIFKLISIPFWHPHSSFMLYYEAEMNSLLISKIFFIYWYYNICNGIIVRRASSSHVIMIYTYTPYVSDNFNLDRHHGCYTAKETVVPIRNLKDDFICEESCVNVSLYSEAREKHLGTCMGYKTTSIRTADSEGLRKLNLFKDKSENLHGMTLRTYCTEVLPFFGIRENSDGSYTLMHRDGMIWNTLMTLMNFTIDLSPSKNIMKRKFNFELSIQQIFSFSHRKVDLFLIPIYLLDFIVVKIDLTFPFKESGVCIVAHRAGFENVLFDINLLEKNYTTIIKFTICFMGVWITFYIFSSTEKGRWTLDQMGKDFTNTVRNVLSISLHRPPKRHVFRIFLTTSIWGFFVINFATQAAITSFFTAFKRGKEVETFDDVIEKGYNIEGMSSPDVVLPDTEERFNKINEKLVPIQDLYECVGRMSDDSHRFCLIDCAIARYLERNRLNEKGEQFLHVIAERIHSHYLSFIFPRHSVLTDRVSKYIMMLVEGGLIKKWEDYRFNDIPEEAEVKALSLEDLIGIFKCYLVLISFSFIVFLGELSTKIFRCFKNNIL